MFIRNNDLRELESMIWGYYAALSVHRIVENVPEMTGHFSSWLRYRYDWSLSAGWAFAITDYMKNENLLDAFFRLVDDYRVLRPVVRASVTLGPSHGPTGKRRVYGFDGRMEKPDSVSIIQYAPEPLHFLRFRYGKRLVNDHVLTKGVMESTTIRDAKAWVRDELQVKFNEWQPCKTPNVRSTQNRKSPARK